MSEGDRKAAMLLRLKVCSECKPTRRKTKSLSPATPAMAFVTVSYLAPQSKDSRRRRAANRRIMHKDYCGLYAIAASSVSIGTVAKVVKLSARAYGNSKLRPWTIAPQL